jgi:methyl-accepting chemotaxis protein
MVEEATAASHLLRTDSAKLSELVAHFTVEGGMSRPAAPAAAAPAPAMPSAHGQDWDDAGDEAPQPIAVNGSAPYSGGDVWQDF